MALITATMSGFPVLVEIAQTEDRQLILRVRNEQSRESVIAELEFQPVDAGGLLSEISLTLTGSIFGGG